jgi:hypothetical protein
MLNRQSRGIQAALLSDGCSACPTLQVPKLLELTVGMLCDNIEAVVSLVGEACIRHIIHPPAISYGAHMVQTTYACKICL